LREGISSVGIVMETLHAVDPQCCHLDAGVCRLELGCTDGRGMTRRLPKNPNKPRGTAISGRAGKATAISAVSACSLFAAPIFLVQMEEASDPFLQLDRIAHIARRYSMIEKFTLYIRGQIIPSQDDRRSEAPQDEIFIVAESGLIVTRPMRSPAFAFPS
jgi:hypothetical protein